MIAVLLTDVFLNGEITHEQKSILRLICCSDFFASLAGCSAPTVITLKDGSQLQTTDKPKYDEDSGFYEFEQLDGKPVRINKDDIHTIKKNVNEVAHA